MTMIVYGNPVSEAAPVLNYRKNYPNGGGLVTIDAELTREITASTLYIKNLIETAQRLTLADELTAAGQSFGHGWTLRDSATIDSADGFETVRLRYLKPNVSPLEYGNPAALSIALTATQGIVKWHGAPAIVYESDKALEGFQLVAGGAVGVQAWVMPVVDAVNRGGGMDGLNPYYYSGGTPRYSAVTAPAYNLTLGGKTVAQAATPRLVRYGFSYYAPVGFEGAPRRIVEWKGGTYAGDAEARTAGLAYYAGTFKPAIVAQAAAAAALRAQGVPVCGFTAVEDGDNGGVVTEVAGNIGGSDVYGFTVWMKATENYILAANLDVQNRAVAPDRYYGGGAMPTPPEYASPAWTVENDVATCTVGGGVLLTVPPDESDSGSAGA